MSDGRRRTRRRLSYEQRILLLAVLTGLPGSVVALVLLWTGDFTPKLQWTLTLFVVGLWLGVAHALRTRVVHVLQTISNLLAALREGDFSIRARGARRNDAHGDVLLEMNALTQTLREQRLDALEATTLLRKIMEEIDVAIFAFDDDRKLRLVNRAGERLLAWPSERLLGSTASELELDDCLDGAAPRVLDRMFHGRAGRWEMRRAQFRQGGLPLQLLVLTDVSRALRQEERQAWQRLIRVLGHELNNSLTPIQSIARSLESLLGRGSRPDDWEDDMRRGLGVIGSRSESLSRFMDAYARLARLPEPSLEPLDLGALVHRVVRLETRQPVELAPGDDLSVQADRDQLEQLLINLVRNAVDATVDGGGKVTAGWTRGPDHVDVWVEDEGPGLPNTANLFVPFFTTKPGGSGIGLVLCRQIAEAHNGNLTVRNRDDRSGCEARLRLPL
jgi:PAS domain S-box-containing protein